MISFAELLRMRNHEAWTRATTHRFVQELGDGTVPDAVLRRYLVQDYAFVTTLASLVGYGVAKAPTMAGKRLFASFAAALTSEENDYFIRAFDALDVPAADREAPTLWPESQSFLTLLREGGEGAWTDILATLLPAEWIYLDWAEAEAPKAPPRFEHREWIALHAAPAFRTFVMTLRAEFDAAADAADAATRNRMADRFARMVRLEGAFFDAAYRAG
ncbi:MAG: TenA family protein [Alphaproteobacteria bacterium]